jgi:hypothetical protein
MLDFVMAPTSFLMGCHVDHFKEVSKVRYMHLICKITLCESLRGLRAAAGALRAEHCRREAREVLCREGRVHCAMSKHTAPS